jgi:hypothetical protein
MYGVRPAAVFYILSNALEGAQEELDRWYLEVHGPDGFEYGLANGLDRYRAAGDYAAGNLTVWECAFADLDEARTAITEFSLATRAAGRVPDLHAVVRAGVQFADGPAGSQPTPAEVRTLTLVEGPAVEVPDPDAAVYRYGWATLVESAEPPEAVIKRWEGVGSPGVATGGPGLADQPDPRHSPVWPQNPWVSHWVPTATLRP